MSLLCRDETWVCTFVCFVVNVAAACTYRQAPAGDKVPGSPITKGGRMLPAPAWGVGEGARGSPAARITSLPL